MNLLPPKPGQHPGLIGNPAAGPVVSTINKMKVCLDIETSMKRVNCGVLLSRIEHPDAVVVNVTAEWMNLDEEGEELPASALNAVKKLPAFIGRELILHEEYYDLQTEEVIPEMIYTKSFLSDNGFFTAEELVDCIVEWEKIHRNAKIWHGAVDAHHVFLEFIDESCNLKGAVIPGRYHPSYGS
jgi:hypothetical protein